MRVAFMGTPEFAVPSLEALLESHEVSLVVTRPDAVRGRGRKLIASPVKKLALEHAVPVIEAKRVTSELVETISNTMPDVIVVAAYGALLPDELLKVPRLETINVHASLLPRWRGAAPIQRAVLAGDEYVGVSIMRVVHELDAGPYCRQATVLAAGRTANALMAELAKCGAVELVAALEDIARGKVIWTQQDETKVTYAPRLTKAEMRLTPTNDALLNARHVAASTDAAPARAVIGGKGLRILVAHASSDDSFESTVFPAGAVRVMGGRVLLGCASGTVLEPTRVRPDGKGDMDVTAWACGLRSDTLTWSEP